jgi:hypothetical protein
VDELKPHEVQELQSLLENEFPGRPVLRCSAKTGEGFDSLTEMLDQRGQFGRRTMDVDYDIYAEGEAELGWLNSQVIVTGATSFDLDQLLMDLIQRLHSRLLTASSEAAHLKVIGMTDGGYAVANLVSNAAGPELSLGSRLAAVRADVVVNARVAADPEFLSQIVQQELEKTTSAVNATFQIVSSQSFRPGRPVPTHRILS